MPNSSYVWKSLMAAQPILKKGCCWRVGDGATIKVMADKWIPNHVTNRVLHPPVEEEWEWRVSDLIDWRTNTWDRVMVEANFHSFDVEAILRIPLSRRYVPDMVFWLHTKDGDYSVKSGYHIARLLAKQDADLGESSREVMGSSIWAKLWKLKIPNKIRIFGWRACMDILPTRSNLARCKILADDRCGVCLQAKESGYHVLWECGLAQDIWAGSSRRLQKGVPGFDDTV